jgi:dUTP pyrophosphatase
MNVKIIVAPGAGLPCYALPGDAGMDLCAHIETEIVLHPMARVLIPTGLRMAIPEGYEGQIRSRSGLSWKYGVVVLNAPGTIDAHFRGEVQVALINLGQEPFVIQPQARIAQLVIHAFCQVQWQPTESLDVSERGARGFGSTGM